MHVVNEVLLASLGMLAIVIVSLVVAAAMAHRWDVLLDRPGLSKETRTHGFRRKLHQKETPMVGGVALLVALPAAFLMIPLPFSSWWSLPFGLVAMGALGLADDLYNLPAVHRFILQFLVSFIVVVIGGIEIQSLGNLLGLGPVPLGSFAAPISVLAIVTIINAVNMLDGIDGLAGSVALLATLAFAVLAFVEGLRELGFFALLLAAGLLGFLAFNLRTPWRQRASVFLGDCGSMMLGFWLAWMAVVLTQMPASGVAPITVALILIFPAGDLLGVFIRRLRLRRNPMFPDRSHTHHVLTRAGYTVGQAVILLMLVYLVWIGFALACHFLGCPEWWVFVVTASVLWGYIGFVLNGHLFIRWCRRTLCLRT